jgi:hypothetical protein
MKLYAGSPPHRVRQIFGDVLLEPAPPQMMSHLPARWGSRGRRRRPWHHLRLRGAHLKRQFEFVKTQWLNDGIFIGVPQESDPLVGASREPTTFTIPRSPIRRRLHELPPFVVTRGGEYCFAPGLRALKWLGNLET